MKTDSTQPNPAALHPVEAPLLGLSSWLHHMAYKFPEDGPTLVQWAREVSALASPVHQAAEPAPSEPHPNCPNAFVCAGRCSGDRCADAMVPLAASPAPRAVAEPGEWTISAPDGKQFSGATPFKAANLANRHRLTVDQVAAQEFGDMLESMAKANAAENARLIEEHGTLNCPACCGSGHIGDNLARLSAAPAPTPSEDARMLDWLERTSPQFARGLDDKGIRRWYIGKNFDITGGTFREAIRAAMSADGAAAQENGA